MKRVFGWNTEQDVANEIYGGPFERLLDGSFVFAFKNPLDSGCLRSVTISKHLGSIEFMIGEISNSGWTAWFPRVPLEYLQSILVKDLKDSKASKEVIENFLEIISSYDKKE